MIRSWSRRRMCAVSIGAAAVGLLCAGCISGKGRTDGGAPVGGDWGFGDVGTGVDARGMDRGGTTPDAGPATHDGPTVSDGLPTDDAPLLDSGSDVRGLADLRAADARIPDARRVDARIPDASRPDATVGLWFQANRVNCVTFCTGKKRVNAPSVEGARCMSGENRVPSGIAAGVKFTYGCWPNCAPMSGSLPSVSAAAFCYRASQKKDKDPSDRTVGCFCK